MYNYFYSFNLKLFNNTMFKFLDIKNIVLLNYYMDVYNSKNFRFHIWIILKNTFFFSFNIIYNCHKNKTISLVIMVEKQWFLSFMKELTSMYKLKRIIIL